MSIESRQLAEIERAIEAWQHATKPEHLSLKACWIDGQMRSITLCHMSLTAFTALKTYNLNRLQLLKGALNGPTTTE